MWTIAARAWAPGFGRGREAHRASSSRSRPFPLHRGLRLRQSLGLSTRQDAGGRALRARLRAHPLLDPFFESTLLDLAVAGEVGYGPAPHRRIEAPDDDPFYALPFIAGLNLLPSLSVVGHVGPAQWDVAGWQYGGGIDLAFRPF